ncbi:class I SAM-dependent methyltransferase, partial [Chloroflexota bacterium]
PTKMVLDIGCGKGGMLQILRNRNYGISKLCGLDMLPEIVQYLNTLEGIKGLAGTIANIPVGDQEAEVIILSNILEHVIDLDGAIQEIDRIISNEGIVYVEVPAASKYPTFEEYPLFDFFFEHVNHFDQIQLCNLVASNDFVMVEHGVKTMDTGCSENNCIYAVFRKGTPNLIRSDHTLADIILRCFEISRVNEFSELNQFIDNGHPIYVWGLSSYMMIMLSQSPLKRCNIISLLDKDIYKQQKTIDGRKIKGPEILKSATSDAVVVIPAGAYVSDMKDYAASIGYKGQLIII